MTRSKTREELLRRALILSILSIILAGIAGVIAVVAALTSGSLSLPGFGLDAAIDSAASIVLVWRFDLEARDPHRAERSRRWSSGTRGNASLVLAAYGADPAMQLGRAASLDPAPLALPSTASRGARTAFEPCTSC